MGATKRQSVRSRNFNSRMMRTRRTRTACLNLHPNCSRRSKPTRNKLRKQKKLQLSILLSSARLNKNLKKLRTVQDLQRVLSMPQSKQLLKLCPDVEDEFALLYLLHIQITYLSL